MTDPSSFDASVPSVHEHETDIDIAALPYETNPGAPSVLALVGTIAGLVATIVLLVIGVPAGAAGAGVVTVVLGVLTFRANRRFGVIHDRNAALLAEAVDPVRSVVEREFGVVIPDDYRPTYFGKPMFIDVIPVGSRTVVLSAGMDGAPTTVLIRFYPMG